MFKNIYSFPKKMFKPKDILDRVCRGHDICYDKVHDDGCPEPYDADYLWNGDNRKRRKNAH